MTGEEIREPYNGVYNEQERTITADGIGTIYIEDDGTLSLTL